jgi:hypothetical protein
MLRHMALHVFQLCVPLATPVQLAYGCSLLICICSAVFASAGFDRLLQLVDASAAQSPLSFGGFGTMLRHLPPPPPHS